MPPGRRRGRRRGRRHRRGISRFLEPCLLLLLKTTDACHGYELTEALTPFGLENLDSSLVYRTLRDMEDAGWAKSEWDAESSGGPARRVYRLTESGNQHLEVWVADLREIDRALHHFLEVYDQYSRR